MSQKELMDVINESIQNDSFREALLRDYEAALRSKEWELSPEDLGKLGDFMNGNQVANAETILNAFSKVAKGTSPPPPPPWQPEQFIK
jgi:hypothetical protein